MDVNLFIFANSKRSVNTGAQRRGSAEGVAEVQLRVISAFALCSKGILIADVVFVAINTIMGSLSLPADHESRASGYGVALVRWREGIPAAENTHHCGFDHAPPKCVC